MGGLNHTLTKEQKEIVDYSGDEILVRGIAGSGKTLVMLRKAKLTAEKYPDRQIAVFTFGKTLTNASQLLLEEMNLSNLHITTFHSWAMKSYYKVTKKRFQMINKRDDFLSDALEKMKGTSSHRYVKEINKYKEFLQDEISWIKGKGIDTEEDYLTANRRGRGSEFRVTEEDRKFIFKIFELYNKEKGKKMDYDDFALKLSKRLDSLPDDTKFDHIFIDEAQDLQQVQLMVLRSIARKSFFVAADKGQKIYKTSFAWKDIGLNITGGRTKILKESFRSTKQIIKLASSLQKNDSIVNDDEYVQIELPEETGPKPTVIECASKKVQDKAIAESVRHIRRKDPNATIGILSRENRKLYRIRHSLKELSIEPEFVNQREGNPYSSGVKLCTIHSSKGLEFDYVIVIDLIEPELDTEVDTEDYWEVERRLLYVAITRATTYLQIYYYGKPSRLLNELDKQLYEKIII